MAKTQPALATAELAALRKKLQDERRRILGVLRQPLASMPPDEPQEFEEMAQRSDERDATLAVHGPERTLLADIDRALAKMDAGAYGLSEQTGAPIPYPRLAAVPWARQGVDEDG